MSNTVGDVSGLVPVDAKVSRPPIREDEDAANRPIEEGATATTIRIREGQ